MKVTCLYCGKIHEKGYVCPKKPVRKSKSRTKDRSDKAVRFRSGGDWSKTARAVKGRDMYMCRVCLDGKYPLKGEGVSGTAPTGERINFVDLEVHHIEKISDRYDLRLCEDNLITLCREHHRMAEHGEIPKKYLRELAKKEVNF